MKILIVMGGFFPGKKYGGPPVSVDNFCSLMKDYECFIVTRDHDLFETERYDNISEGWNERDNCKVKYLPDPEYGKAGFEKAFAESNPDIIYLQGLFQTCVLPCLELAKKHRIPVLLAPRGELCANALSIRKYKKIPYIVTLRLMGLLKHIHWQSTSDEESEAIKKWMNARDNTIHRLKNIPSVPSRDYPRQVKEAGVGRFVFLSRIHPKKNLLFAIKLFHDIKGNVIFDIYGPIEDEEYWVKCKEEMAKLPCNVKVEYKGLVIHEQVHAIFSKYDAFLFPTLSENYGHVIAESMMVGTPVIVSNQTAWTNLEKVKAGWDINLSDSNSFSHVINQVILLNSNQMEQIRENTRSYIYSISRLDGLKAEYIDVINKLK